MGIRKKNKRPPAGAKNRGLRARRQATYVAKNGLKTGECRMVVLGKPRVNGLKVAFVGDFLIVFQME